jgi:hypothetical protein
VIAAGVRPGVSRLGVAGTEGERAAARHRVDGVDAAVHQRVQEGAVVAADRPEVVVELHSEAHLREGAGVAVGEFLGPEGMKALRGGGVVDELPPSHP